MREIRPLNGLVAPAGEGMVLEVHLDIMDAPASFLQSLGLMGFENDPFLDFYPAQYGLHYTGRARVPPSSLRSILPGVHGLVAHVIEESRVADVRLYAEIELVRDVHHFGDSPVRRGLTSLEPFTFAENRLQPVKADIHVEFRSGTVPIETRALLQANRFYWVRTPETEHFPSEEIATLQTSTFRGAQLVYDRLVETPLPACTGVHLEQKLAMLPSHDGLPMPPVTAVTARGQVMMYSGE